MIGPQNLRGRRTPAPEPIIIPNRADQPGPSTSAAPEPPTQRQNLATRGRNASVMRSRRSSVSRQGNPPPQQNPPPEHGLPGEQRHTRHYSTGSNTSRFSRSEFRPRAASCRDLGLTWNRNYHTEPYFAPPEYGQPHCLASKNEYVPDWTNSGRFLRYADRFDPRTATGCLKFGSCFPSARVSQLLFAEDAVDVTFEDNGFIRVNRDMFLDMLRRTVAAPFLRVNGQSINIQHNISVPSWEGFLANVADIRISGTIHGLMLNRIISYLDEASSLSVVAEILTELTMPDFIRSLNANLLTAA